MKNKDKTDLLLSIRNGVNLTAIQKIQLVIRLSIPAILAQISSIIMQYIDASMVGQMGANDSASIGLVASSTWLFGCICSAFSAGFYIQSAQYIGAKEYRQAYHVMRYAFRFIVPLALLIAAIGIIISKPLPTLLGGAKDIRHNATLYFLIYSCGLPAMAINALAEGLLQSSGNMKVPSILNSFMCLLDVLFNAFFIFPTLSFKSLHLELHGLGLGVIGAALGTTLAEYVIAFIMLYFLRIKSPYYSKRLIENQLDISKQLTNQGFSNYVKKACKISFPIALENVIVCSAYIASTKIVAPLGVISIAANSFAVTAESLCYMPGYGISSASTTLIGQSIGAKRKELALSFGKVTIAFGMILMACSGAFMYMCAPIMIGLLTPDASVRALGIKILRIEAFAEPLYGASIVVTGNLRGAGDTLIPSVLNLISMWCVRIPLSYVLSIHYGLTGVWIAMCAELCFRGTIFLIRFGRKRWLNIKVTD